MSKHLTVRLAWHNEGWNGHICKNPSGNTYCVGRYSYPGDRISDTRDINLENEHAGKSCANCRAACQFSVNAFGNETITATAYPPYDAYKADPVDIVLPPSTACTWCFELMYDKAKDGNGRVSNIKRRENAERYFSQFEPGKSLVFYSVGYSNPFCEEEENNYVVVGISRVKSIGGICCYKNVPTELMQKYGGGLVWQRPITSTYPEEGFRIPFWKYMDREDVLDRIVLKPQNKSPFKYASREVGNDDAIEIVNQLLGVVDVLIELGDDTENWNVRKAWLNSVLNELWTARGPYPGFPSVLEALGLSRLVSDYILLTSNEDMKNFRGEVRSLLDGGQDTVAGQVFSRVELQRLRREYQLLGRETSYFLFNVLSRFALTTKQIKGIVSEERENVSITASISEMAENPYLIFEQYHGIDPDDVIQFYQIDNGVIPSPEYGGVEALFDVGATERLRAFCVDELNKIAAHSFGKAETILNAINSRLDRMPEWKRYGFKLANFGIDRNILECALVFKDGPDQSLYLYLKEVYEDERVVEKTLMALASRSDIGLRMAITPEGFKQNLMVRDSPLVAHAKEEYEAVLGNQATICMQIFAKPLCVLSGAAGTGKTTVIRAILDNIERVHGLGTSFLLLAPTGKAAERIKTQTGKPASTIHAYLAKNGWIADNYTFKRTGGRSGQDVNTIIIDECSMMDLNLFATLFRAINWNSVQRLILVGDPNQLPPIGRGRVFSDVIQWLNTEHPTCVGRLKDNIRQLVNTVTGNGRGILDLASVFIQEDQQSGGQVQLANLKDKKEELFAKIATEGNGDVDKDLGVYFWVQQKDLEELVTKVMIKDMEGKTGLHADDGIDKLWQTMIRRDGDARTPNPEIVQVISPYRGEFYGTDSLNLLMQKTFNGQFSAKKLDGIGYIDKVIQYRNRPPSDPAYACQEDSREMVLAEIYNGEIGIATRHCYDAPGDYDGELKRLQVRFAGRPRQGLRYCYGKELGHDSEGRYIPDQKVADNLELAYVISVHKSQGSEFDYVYVVIPKRDSHLLSMELLYTALTRAQKKVTIFVQQDIGTLADLSRVEKSAVRKINSSVFEFKPLPEELLYPGFKWYESGKRISTLSPYFVRSKSEAIIANMLSDRDIPFKYEEPLYASDGTSYLPDFTVTFRGETYYWEHMGMLDLPTYRAHWEKKQAWYNEHFPGKLLVTYESNNLSKDVASLIDAHQ